MMNNYFEYQDFAKVDKTLVSASVNATLQTGSSVEQLKKDTVPYDYASFEEDAYITANPKTLASTTKKLGVLTANVSSATGSTNVKIDITLPDVFIVPGITLWCVNQLSRVKISYYDTNNNEIRSEVFNSDYITEKKQFFNMSSESVKRVVINVLGTVNPYHFVGIYRIDFGSVRIFDSTNLVDAKVTNYFRLEGDTIEYDILQADIFHEDDTEYLFSKKQVIAYKDSNGEDIGKFYIDTGSQKTDNTVSIKAYDSVSLLEDDFLGGIYGFEDVYTGQAGTPYPYNQLLADIFNGTGVEYRTVNTDDISVTGYIPICTRRRALALLCYGTNTRCFKENGVLVFKPISIGNDVEYDETVILDDPTIKTAQKIGKITVIEHNYKKSDEEVELYNWYLQQGENTMQLIEFSEPVWKIRAYEVTGVDADGFEIISEADLKEKLIFSHAPIGDGQDDGDEHACNYCIIKTNSISNKIIIKGWKISDSKHKVVVSNPNVDVNAEYDEMEIEGITISSGIEDVAKIQYAIGNQRKKQTIELVNVSRPKVGDNISTTFVSSPAVISSDKGDIPIDVKITSVVDDLSGIYKVVAE